MLTKVELDLLWVVEVACHRCIQAAKYFDFASGSKENVWAFTQNCYGGICIIHWCQVFGSRSEPTHYSHLFDNGMLAQWDKDNVADRLRTALDMDEAQYRVFWQGVKDARDKYLVHNDFTNPDKPIFPDTDLLVKTCLVMRIVVRDIAESESAEDSNFHGNIRRFVSCHTNERFMSEINHELKLLQETMPGRK